MKQRLRFIFFLAVITAVGILVFQVYWVYNSYQTGKRNFNTQILNALQKSLDSYPLRGNKLAATLNSKKPSLAVMSSFDKDPKKNNLYSVQLQPLNVSPANLLVVQQMVARLMSQTIGKPINLDTLSLIFNNELKNEHINLAFELNLLRDQKQLPAGKIAAFAGFSKDSDIIEATPVNFNSYLIEQNIVPSLISILLILLSGGSLYYMGLIIRRQMKVDGLKNDFISNITHELRTPIAILKSTHEALYQFGESADAETTSRYLQINTGILIKLENNVDRILDITSYEERGMPAEVSLVNIDELIANVLKRFPANKLNYRPLLPIQEKFTDGYMIDTIVTNLVDNAIKYNHGDVLVSIRTSQTVTGWQLQVEDNGKGINDVYLPFIFDKFYRVPSGELHDVKGYGLGLSYVKALINSLKGQITVKSKLNKGTIFTIQFPNG